MKPFIVIGDKTSHGGVVISGSTTSGTNGKAIARVGDKVTCPKKGCPSITTIATTSDPTIIVDGMPGAFHGDKTACGATLIASQVVTNSAPQGNDGTSRSSSGATLAGGLSTVAAQSSLSNDEQDEIVEQYYEALGADDNPVQGYRYDLFSNGTAIKKAGNLSTGITIAKNGDAELALVAWLNKAGEIKS